MRIVIKGVEKRWFDDFGQFCTYILKKAKIDEIVDEDYLVWHVARTLQMLEIHPDNVEELRENIRDIYGIAEEYIDLILEKVRYELILYEADLEDPDEKEEVVERPKEIDKEVFRRILIDVQRMYFELDLHRETIIKEIALTYGLSLEEAREVVGMAENYIFY